MAWHSSPRTRIAELERLLHDAEGRLARLSRTASRASAAAPGAVDRVADTVATALNDIADRFRSRARATGDDAAYLSDEAFRLGNDVLRKLTREVEQRPLITLAVAVGIGALAAGLFARRD